MMRMSHHLLLPDGRAGHLVEVSSNLQLHSELKRQRNMRSCPSNFRLAKMTGDWVRVRVSIRVRAKGLGLGLGLGSPWLPVNGGRVMGGLHGGVIYYVSY